MSQLISKIFYSRLFLFFVLLFFLAITFYRLPQTFFQQDEWRAFERMTVLEQDFIKGINLFLPKNFLGHINIFTILVEFFEFKLFRLNFVPYALASLFLHFFNSLLVYKLTSVISKRKVLGLVASLIFITSSISHQATTWMSAGTSVQGATFFALISIILFFNYLKGGQKKIRFFLFSIISFLISLSFKENTIFLFIFFPIFWFVMDSERTLLNFKKMLFPLFIFFCLYFLMRGLFLFNNTNFSNVDLVETSKITDTSFSNYAYRSFSMPFKALSQSFFTASFLVTLSRNFVLIAYPHSLVAADGEPNPYVVESIAFDYLGFVLSIFILLFALFVYEKLSKTKDKNGINLLKFSLILTIVSYVPFIFLPGSGGFISIAEPRNLYIPNIGSSIFLALAIITFSSWIGEKIKFRSSSFLVLLFLFLLMYIHIGGVWRDLKALQDRSQIRLGILKTISSSHPELPKKIVFYTESDTAYYGLPNDEKILPFQSGFGQILLVWYNSNGQKIPRCFFTDWLYRLDKDQGYRYCEGRGFGYFRKYDSLKTALVENNLSSEDVISFSWDSKNKKFSETTTKIRERLKEASVN